MRHDLWECPQVVRILSASCPQSVRDMSERCRVIGALYRTWCIFDRFTEDGILTGYTPEILNDEIGIENWAENLQHVGWLMIEEQSLVVPEFTEYFGDSARRRMKDRKRKAESRKTCPQNVHVVADKKRTTEQNRTEQKNTLSTNVERERVRATRPTLEEVTAYAQQINCNDPAGFFDFYSANGWKVGRNPMKDWQATLRNWQRRQGEFTATKAAPAKRTVRELLDQAFKKDGTNGDGK